ncbi:TolB family protein [Streptomyces sp. NPDC093546]|uniref:TolB family protein n=1 Tax=Streptomyces sp. NPDC093546 TaxID=3366040 RepID=UPI00382FB699
MRRNLRYAATTALAVVAFATATAPPAAADWPTGRTERVTLTSTGAQAAKGSLGGSMSADGRYVTLVSHSADLVPGDTNGITDVFVRDRQTGTVERLNLTPSGGQSKTPAYDPEISPDGRYVAFKSAAADLVAGDTNGKDDFFIRDRQTRTTRKITGTVPDFSLFSVSFSPDSRYAGYAAGGIHLYDLQSGTLTRVGPWRDDVYGVTLGTGARHIAFESHRTDIVADDTNGTGNDVFVHDRQTGTTEIVSRGNDGRQASGATDTAISADGRYVYFSSGTQGLVPGDTDTFSDVFVRDRQAQTTTRVSVASDGRSGQPPAEIWVPGSRFPVISPDGRYAVFSSTMKGLDPLDTGAEFDAFVHDLQTGTTHLVSRADGTGTAHKGDAVDVSADGRTVSFTSYATDLVPGDTNAETDVFVRVR